MSDETLKLRDGRRVVLRSSRRGDGPAVHAYIKALGESTENILTYPDDTPGLEPIVQRIELIESGRFYSLVAMDPDTGQVAGNTSYTIGARKKLAHSAELGMGVLPAWQRVGLGAMMLNRSIEDMRANPNIHRLSLTVLDGNDHALKMYQKAGFELEGRRVRSVRQPDGTYADEIVMGMWIGE
jgi:RimJ/RimL family protein N-acetyltransferase